jgi:hypothetical protein
MVLNYESEFEKSLKENVDEFTPEANRNLDAIRNVASTKQGRRFIGLIFKHCGLMDSGYNVDPGIMARNEGMREVAIYFKQMLDMVSPESFLLILKEAKEDLQADDRTNNNNSE